MNKPQKILLTCPPMINQIHKYKKKFKYLNWDVTIPEFTQEMSENKLIDIIGNYDGWIIGDDPATYKVLEKGKKGKLKAVVKWGVGVDNVDFRACKELNIKAENTPNMFGNEVADIALAYLLGLLRKTYFIHNEVKKGNWTKPIGNSIANKKIALIGFGDIGRSVAKRLLGFDVNIYVSDPGFSQSDDNKIKCLYNSNIDREILGFYNKVKICKLNDVLKNADFIVITCALNKNTLNMINKDKILLAKKGVGIVNVSRGKILNQNDVIDLLDTKYISGVALDVYESEPITLDNPLLKYDCNIFGTHNSSNTVEAVDRTSYKVINLLSNNLSI